MVGCFCVRNCTGVGGGSGVSNGSADSDLRECMGWVASLGGRGLFDDGVG